MRWVSEEVKSFAAFLIPWSVTGQISGLQRAKIRNMSADHSPRPFTEVSSFLSSGSESSNHFSG